jgi:hypothetical protein
MHERIYAMSEDDKKPETSLKLEGEGSYEGAKQYQDAQNDFAENGPVEEKAREAADALDGEEGDELEEARKKSSHGESL